MDHQHGRFEVQGLGRPQAGIGAGEAQQPDTQTPDEGVSVGAGDQARVGNVTENCDAGCVPADVAKVAALQRVDCVVVASSERRGTLPKVGRAEYLHTLVACVPSTGSGGWYAQRVREEAARR